VVAEEKALTPEVEMEVKVVEPVPLHAQTCRGYLGEDEDKHFVPFRDTVPLTL
jgi:hypothetical protein